MSVTKISAIEKLRRIWTPGKEIEEIVANLEPQTYLDSQIRHILHAVIQQNGPQTIDLGSELDPVLNTGTLRWEVVHGPGPDNLPEMRRRQISVWVEE